ncbi:MAG: HlyD family efflux transporter periplasmic adaptor subunit [Synergistaceae bacterium]|nr:HlyD family efflux transporter periplasmic adaptor subunit [Synergistaceae bacterium]
MRAVKKVAALAVIAAAVGAAGWFWFSYSERESKTLVLYGNVDQRQVDLAFIDSERVIEVLVDEGAEVLEGQVLARLETRRLRDQIAVAEADVAAADATLTKLKNGTRPEEIAQARAAVASAQATATYAEEQYERFASLWKNSGAKAVSKQDVDDALRQRDVARASLDSERKALRLAEIGPRVEDIAEAEATLLGRKRTLTQLRNNLGDAELKSPAHATVSKRLLEPGDMASPSKAVFSLAVLSPKWVRVYAAETRLGQIRPGMKVAVRTDSFPDEIPGTVGFISSVAEFTPKNVETPELRTSLVYEVRVYVSDEENRLRLGMPATVVFPKP